MKSVNIAFVVFVMFADARNFLILGAPVLRSKKVHFEPCSLTNPLDLKVFRRVMKNKYKKTTTKTNIVAYTINYIYYKLRA